MEQKKHYVSEQTLINMPNNSSDISLSDKQSCLSTATPTALDIRTWLADYIAEALEIPSDEMDITVSFEQYGLDSLAAVGMTTDLEDWLNCEIDPTLPYEYPTIETLSDQLASSIG